MDYIIAAGNLRSEFRLSYYPHKFEGFTNMLKGVFGEKAKHDIFGDFKTLKEIPKPDFYVHCIQK